MDISRDPGPAIDIGPAMTRKILKSDGEVVFRSTVRYLIQDEWVDPDFKRQRQY